mmetsp:Transcript_8836/g.25675  ORF Transcript_8836/g.25675 Transcript_8836/m.25675 type:complete len:426 (+) Transcript_8836:217-1494(+)
MARRPARRLRAEFALQQRPHRRQGGMGPRGVALSAERPAARGEAPRAPAGALRHRLDPRRDVCEGRGPLPAAADLSRSLRPRRCARGRPPHGARDARGRHSMALLARGGRHDGAALEPRVRDLRGGPAHRGRPRRGARGGHASLRGPRNAAALGRAARGGVREARRGVFGARGRPRPRAGAPQCCDVSSRLCPALPPRVSGFALSHGSVPRAIRRSRCGERRRAQVPPARPLRLGRHARYGLPRDREPELLPPHRAQRLRGGAREHAAHDHRHEHGAQRPELRRRANGGAEKWTCDAIARGRVGSARPSAKRRTRARRVQRRRRRRGLLWCRARRRYPRAVRGRRSRGRGVRGGVRGQHHCSLEERGAAGGSRPGAAAAAGRRRRLPRAPVGAYLPQSRDADWRMERALAGPRGGRRRACGASGR